MPRWIVDLVCLAALWGASFLFMRMGAAEFGPMASAFLRVFIAMLFLLPLLVLRRQTDALRQNLKPILLVGMLNSGIPFACYSYALLSISAGLSSILNATTPLFGALVAWVWLKDRPNRLRMLGLVIGFVGVSMLAWDKASLRPGGGALAIAACMVATLCYGLAGSFTKRFLSGVPPMATAAGSQIGASLGLVLPALWFWPAQLPGFGPWLAMAASGVLCTGLAYILYFRLIEAAGPARALAVTFVVPVFAVIYGVLFLHETVTLWMVVCALVIVCGTALSSGLVGRKS